VVNFTFNLVYNWCSDKSALNMERGNRRIQFLITSAVNLYSRPMRHQPAEISWMVAISSLGFMVGSLVSRFTSDKYGRRATLLASVLPLSIGVVLKLLARQAWTLRFARFLWGVATGMIASVSTIYLAEISDKDLRGRLILGNRFMFSFGCMVTMAVGPFVDYQTINYSLVLLPICYFSACWWIPETPYFLLKEGKVDAARETLARLTSIRDEEVLEKRLSQMESDVRKEMKRSGTVKELFTGKQYRKAIIILMAGIHAIQQYLGPIINESKSGMNTSTALIIFGVVRFTLGILSSLLVDRLGRRPLIIYSYFGSGLCLAIVGAYFFIGVHPSSSTLNPYGFIPFVGIMLATVISVLGFESVVYMLPAELFPLNIKSVAMTAVNIYGGLLNFISVKSYQQIKDLGGLSAVFWVFATATLSGAVFSMFFVPETKCKSLRQIQIELQGNIYDECSEEMQPAVLKW
ncbi:Uncharacterized protein OBRU01_13454, partial [Operophtera brumata]